MTGTDNLSRLRATGTVEGLAKRSWGEVGFRPRVGGEDILQQGLKVSSSQAVGGFDVVISPAGGRLDGVVVNSSQEATGGTHVAVVPDQARRAQTHFYKSTTTDQYGRFTLRGIAPGEYKLFAWEKVEPGAYQDPEFLKPYEERGAPVRLQEGDAQTVQLELIPADESQE